MQQTVLEDQNKVGIGVMSSEVRVHGMENEPAQLLTSPSFIWAEPSVEEISLKM